MLEIQNAVINGVLCYIASARLTLSDQAMISICQAFYSHEKIFEAKELLYNFTDDNIVKRRGDGRVKADLTDIITLFRKLEENNVQLPKFLADDFRSIPPVSGYEVIAEHIIDLMSEMARLREEIESLKKGCDHSSSADGFVDIKEDIYDIKNILLQKSIAPSPSPVLTYAGVTANSTSGSLSVPAHNGSETLSRTCEPVAGTSTSSGNFPGSSKEGHQQMGRASKTSQMSVASLSECDGSGSLNNLHSGEPTGAGVNGSGGSKVDGGNSASNCGSESSSRFEWKTVQKSDRRRKDIIKGTRKGNGLFKGVSGNCDLYVGKCDKSVTIDTIMEYIKVEYDINVISCECLHNNRDDINSFKVTLSFEDRNKMLNPNLWPENILVRKYFSGKSRKHGRNDKS